MLGLLKLRASTQKRHCQKHKRVNANGQDSPSAFQPEVVLTGPNTNQLKVLVFVWSIF